MAQYSFSKDIKDGERFEHLVMSYLNSFRLCNKVVKNEDKRKLKYFDLCTEEYIQTRSGTKWEVKLDKDSQKYPNIFFEMFDRYGRKSGMLATWADFIVYGVVADNKIEVYQFPYIDLMAFLFQYPCEYKKQSGDDKKTRGFVVPREILLGQPWVSRLTTVNKWWDDPVKTERMVA